MAEAGPEALQYKTLFLKVSIHCEGCKKKVRRVLQNMDGVYKVEIDSLQHKVAVTGSVDYDMLIRRLNKYGKQASIWPEAKKPGGDQKPTSSNDTKSMNNESNSKPKDKELKESSDIPKEKQPEPAKDKGSDKGPEKEKAKEKPKTEEKTTSKPQEKEKEKEKENVVEKQMPKEKEKEKPKEQSEQEATQSNSGQNKKEKKEQSEKENESSGKEEGPVAKGLNPMQPNQEFMYPSYSYQYPPQPIMSYHMAQPTSSQAYYQQPPMPGMQGYMYPYQNPHPYPYPYPYGAPSEFNYGSTAESSTRGEDTFGYFNEENANSCSVM
ncbi:Heavy metal-associated isoprenylated plant protein 35 [Rhynchospora pubera]|uniref:Heavy metal-associated isoprenylated plant protein 35 n=1 Tax=Rhynchospora pubera TaxID=906938 RepID=A0AAV8D767_9POAL|nr:Heavy metal-associated isoprenylated plant protein 35 [Rhynchospora pubera]KAJ4764555.1 Heavy metal-associated isoprenylated plant protein 35 [Rhynchospora pubera]KAJ4793437.1 Heavy metal-associated isoprenylated plant protein 35 [Rhynchospora pubera]